MSDEPETPAEEENMECPLCGTEGMLIGDRWVCRNYGGCDLAPG